MTDDEIRYCQREAAEAVSDEAMCDNRVMLSNMGHLIPGLDRCQIVLRTDTRRSRMLADGMPAPWAPGPYNTNIDAIARCEKCRAARPNAWLADIPFERFKGYLLGVMSTCGPQDAVTITYGRLRPDWKPPT
jgi:hypothetical protein